MSPKKMSHADLLAALAPDAPDVIREMETRSGGMLPCVGTKPDPALAAAFLDHVAALRSNGLQYRGTEFKGHPLVSISVIMAPPKVALVCEPFQGHPLDDSGVDPETEMAYPVNDAPLMSKICWAAEYLPSVSSTFRASDLDAQHAVMEALRTGVLTPNLRALMRKWTEATKEQREDAERRLKLDYWPRVGSTQPLPEAHQPQVVEFLAPFSASSGAKLVYALGLPEHVERLKKSLHFAIKSGALRIVSDADIVGGAIRRDVIGQWVRDASAFVYLATSDLLADYHDRIDMCLTMRPDARHIPILVKACGLKHGPLGRQTALPRDGKPVSTGDPDTRWTEVAEGLSGALRL